MRNGAASIAILREEARHKARALRDSAALPRFLEFVERGGDSF